MSPPAGIVSVTKSRRLVDAADGVVDRVEGPDLVAPTTIVPYPSPTRIRAWTGIWPRTDPWLRGPTGRPCPAPPAGAPTPSPSGRDRRGRDRNGERRDHPAAARMSTEFRRVRSGGIHCHLGLEMRRWWSRPGQGWSARSSLPRSATRLHSQVVHEAGFAGPGTPRGPPPDGRCHSAPASAVHAAARATGLRRPAPSVSGPAADAGPVPDRSRSCRRARGREARSAARTRRLRQRRNQVPVRGGSRHRESRLRQQQTALGRGIDPSGLGRRAIGSRPRSDSVSLSRRR